MSRLQGVAVMLQRVAVPLTCKPEAHREAQRAPERERRRPCAASLGHRAHLRARRALGRRAGRAAHPTAGQQQGRISESWAAHRGRQLRNALSAQRSALVPYAPLAAAVRAAQSEDSAQCLELSLSAVQSLAYAAAPGQVRESPTCRGIATAGLPCKASGLALVLSIRGKMIKSSDKGT